MGVTFNKRGPKEHLQNIDALIRHGLAANTTNGTDSTFDQYRDGHEVLEFENDILTQIEEKYKNIRFD